VSEVIEDFPVEAVEFTKEGTIAKPEQADAAVALVGDEKLTDLLVFSHGWNNDMDQAWSLYRAWLAVIRPAVTRQGWTDANRKIGAVAVLWPSKQFAEPDAIPGGAASFGDDTNDLAAQVDALDGVLAPDVQATLRGLASQIEHDADAQKAFVETALGVLSDTYASDAEAANEIPKSLFTAGADLLSQFSDFDETDFMAVSEGGAAALDDTGSATGLSEFFGNVVAGARNLLNYVTYYKMKERAGFVGRRGLAAVLKQIRAAHPTVRIHLVGHSFGCRLVTASLLGTDDGVAVNVDSMSLLQAAFSHNGFALDYDGTSDGFFRLVVAPARRVLGPTMITHTKNDRAVGIAYPLASRLAGQVASALGDADDKYGALGRNGAVKTPEAFERPMLAAGKDYDGLRDHQVHNLQADAFISAHSDVRGAEVGEVIVQAIGAT
jgi:pimeloyl-ACP methyl ester carboxylesterase